MREFLLSNDERYKLEEYRVCFNQAATNNAAMPVNDMFDETKLTAFLTGIKNKLQAPDLMVAASAFSKRYSYLLVVPAYYSFSLLNKQLNMASANLAIIPTESEENWLPRIHLVDQKAIGPDTEDERTVIRNNLTEMIFAKHLCPIWDKISEICKIPKQILWENTAIYLFWLYESLLDREDIGLKMKDTIRADFDFLLQQEKGNLFGNSARNPLCKFFCEKTNCDGEEVRFRKTCCFYYELSKEKDMCRGCPKKVVH